MTSSVRCHCPTLFSNFLNRTLRLSGSPHDIVVVVSHFDPLSWRREQIRYREEMGNKRKSDFDGLILTP